LLVCAVTAALVACAERPAPKAAEPPSVPQPSLDMFAGLPVLPGSRLVGGTPDAAEAVVRVPVSADSVADFYRGVFVQRGWVIRGDATTPDGSVTLHAASPENRPVWIMIRPAGDTAADVSIIATAVHAADSARPR